MQTTAIDHEAGLIRLTTVLAHSSGEWVSSDWPVCPVTETAVPHRMGAALTYARRYSLFTLVGIAGEDDLDAPDLPTVHSDGGLPNLGDPEKMNGIAQTAATPAGGPRNRGRHKITRGLAPIQLPPDQSAALRERLLGEIAALQSTENATSWAQDGIIAKDNLAATDANLVEEAFAFKLSKLSKAEPNEPASPAIGRETEGTLLELAGPTLRRNDAPPVIDKSALSIAEPRRYRNKEHLRFVAQQACLVCGRKPSDPHHLRFMQPRALGWKVSDEFVAPLCRIHHRAVHRVGDERGWWKQVGIDPIKVARKLWRNSRLNESSPRPPLGPEPSGAAVPKFDGAGGKAPT